MIDLPVRNRRIGISRVFYDTESESRELFQKKYHEAFYRKRSNLIKQNAKVENLSPAMNQATYQVRIKTENHFVNSMAFY